MLHVVKGSRVSNVVFVSLSGFDYSMPSLYQPKLFMSIFLQWIPTSGDYVTYHTAEGSRLGSTVACTSAAI